jgi:hypothetical protein
MTPSESTNLLTCYRSLFRYYRELGDKAMAQIPPDAFHWQPSPESNSVAIIVQHLSGNMVSRFTNFLTTDGEKPWRNRDEEFEPQDADAATILKNWDMGWKVVFDTLDALTPDDLEKIVYIRNQGHTVLEALSRQLAHYPYHIGQIVYLCRLLAGEDWASLSIPKGDSQAFNAEKFAEEKQRKFFTQ